MGYGDFDSRLMSAIARPLSASTAMDAISPLRCASMRCSRPGARLGAALSASMITMGTRASVAGG